MQPANLQVEHFAAYPAQARRLATDHLPALRQLPLSFLPSLLRELIDYDFKFPAERSVLDKELGCLSGLSAAQLQSWFRPFAELPVSDKLEQFDWINQPAQFLEQQSAYLWSTGQLDAFRRAATEYNDRLHQVVPEEQLPAKRLGVAVIGQGVAAYDGALFRKLRPHGTYFTHIRPENGLQQILATAAARAQAHPEPYAHWYVDGGPFADHNPVLTGVSYQTLEPVRTSLLRTMQHEIARPGMGPEELRTSMARLNPPDVGLHDPSDEVLNRFQVRLFTEGSGTQIFSTTFAQWTTREALRRAQPLTLVARFAPRQRQRPMNELLANAHGESELDPMGSLVDGDFAAWYHWLNQQRLPGAQESSFVAWFEGHSQAIAIGPSLPRGTQSSSSLDLAGLLSLVAS